MLDADLASSVRRGGRIPTSDAEVAFQCQTRTSHPLSDAKVARRGPRILCQTRRSPDAEPASFLRRGDCPTRTSRPFSDAEIARPIMERFKGLVTPQFLYK